MGSNEMTLKTRIIHKHETEADWLKATGFTPLQGELIIYDVDDTHNYERFKIGDGKTNVNNLSFGISTIPSSIIDEICVMTTQINMLEGDGQSINTYAFTPLSFRSEGAIDTFETVKVDGETVNPSNYQVNEGSTIITFNEAWTKTLSEDEHEVEIIHSVGTASARIDVSNAKVIPEGATYQIAGGETLNAGQNFPENVNDGDVFTYGDYNYTYYGSRVNYPGWDVQANEPWATSFGSILSIINGEPVTMMTQTFYMSSITDASNIIIPDTIREMVHTFGSSQITKAPLILNGVSHMSLCFEYCESLEAKPYIPSSVETAESDIFAGCTQFGY